jgi:hypothetical protein
MDYGKVEIRTTLPNGAPLPMPVVWPYADVGVVWKITKVAANTTTSAGGTQSPTPSPPIAAVPGLTPSH